jgi:hypothetical protein
MFATLKYHRSPEHKAIQKSLEEQLSPEDYALIKKGNRKNLLKDTTVDAGICSALLVSAFFVGLKTRENEKLKAKINENQTEE